MKIQDFPENLKKKLHEELIMYFDTGNCYSPKKNINAALNPTFLEPKTFCWRVGITMCPFDSYFPLHLDQLETSAQDGIITRYCQKKLKNLVSEYRSTQNTVKFHFDLCDDLNFCLSNTSEKFDVIDCSTLADSVGLANLILSSFQKLEQHPDALLLTDSINLEHIAPSVAHYLEESLCVPLSMIPTIYGLRLANQVDLGSVNLERSCSTLSWHYAHRSVNLPLSNSILLERCLKNLQKKSYFMEEESYSSGFDTRSVKRYTDTPLTFNLVAARIAKFDGSENKKESAHWMKTLQSKVAPRFALAMKTLDDWANHRPVTQVTATKSVTGSFPNLFNQNQMLSYAPTLRLILVPSASYVERNIHPTSKPFHWAAEIPLTHYIDNFNLCYQRNQDGSFRSVQVSFLLPQKHELEKNYCGAVIDAIRGTTVLSLGPIKDMRQQIYDIPHPIFAKISPIPGGVTPFMDAVSCQESDTNYCVKILIHAVQNFQGNYLLNVQIVSYLIISYDFQVYASPLPTLGNFLVDVVLPFLFPNREALCASLFLTTLMQLSRSK